MTLVLALESSCDETAAALVRDGVVLSSVVSSQVDVHAAFGGVVPELASRHHLTSCVPVVEQALADAAVGWADIQLIAATEGPGLVGALLIGVQMARGLALALDRPLIGIHHLEGHLFSPLLGDNTRPVTPFQPHVALLVSGGHTELVDVAALGDYTILGATRDDAVGEAYDKVGKLLGLGYPGGPVVDRLAAEGDPTAHTFPRAMLDRDNFDFSFSGLKTAVLVHVEKHGQPESRQSLADLCASFQAAVVDVLLGKAVRALKAAGRTSLHIVGGVAANRGLRMQSEVRGKANGFKVVVPPLRYCGDNAAMIGGAAIARWAAGDRRPLELHTSMPLDDARLRIPV